MDTDLKNITFTGSIPQCPYCRVPTTRVQGYTTKTQTDFPPIYDEEGVNINPNKNTATTNYSCNTCNKHYSVIGSPLEGFVYNLYNSN